MTTNKKGQEIFTIVGTVLRKFPPTTGSGKGGKQWTKNQFLIKTVEGSDLYISKFGSFSAELIGKDVSFQATKYNDTNYTVEGEIAEAVIAAPIAALPPAGIVVEAPKRRGRPAKVEAIVDAELDKQLPAKAIVTEKQQPALSGRESYRSEAEASVVTNLNSARSVLTELKLLGNYTVRDLVAVADLIGRTQTAIFMDAKKDQHMMSFSR